MKKKVLFLVLVSLGLVAITLSRKGMCFTCPVGHICYSDLNCSTLMCNLSCVAIDTMGQDRRCMR